MYKSKSKKLIKNIKIGLQALSLHCYEDL